MRFPGLYALAVAVLAAALAAPVTAQDRDNPYLREVPDTTDADPREPVSPADEATPDRIPIRRHQTGAPRRGPYYASFGLGVGSEAIAELGAPAPYYPSRLRPTLTFGLGAGVGQALRIGFEGFAWFNITGDGALETVTAGMIGARIYPIPNGGLYFRAAGGFGRYGQDLLDDYCDCSLPIAEEYGLAWAIGGGYEVPVGNGLWLGPSVEMIRMDVTGPDGYRERVLNFGLTLTFDGHH